MVTDDLGQHGQEAVDVLGGGVAGERDPDVAVGQHPHRLEHPAGGEGRGRAGRAARHAVPAPVQLGHQRLAVDVQAGEGDQVGEPVDRVADDLDVGDLRDRRPDPVDERELASVDLVALGHDRAQGSGRGQRRGDVLEPAGALVDPVVAGERVAPAGALADQQHADAGRASPLVRRARQRVPAAGERQPAHRGTGVDEERDASRAARPRPTGWIVATSWLAVWSAATATPGSGGRLREVGGGDPPRAVDRDLRVVAPAQPPGRVGAPRSARPAACATREPSRDCACARPSSPRCTASVPDGVKVTSSGRTSRHSATTARALSSSSRASRPGPWSRRGSAYPRSYAASSVSRAAGCRGSADAESR